MGFRLKLIDNSLTLIATMGIPQARETALSGGALWLVLPHTGSRAGHC